jgi:RNA polymerase sigma factor (sigma-70 family)
MTAAEDGPESLAARFLRETAENGELDRQLNRLIANWPRLMDAGDLRQIAVSRAWELRTSFRGTTQQEFLAWVRQLAWSAALDLWRSQGRRRRLSERLAEFVPSLAHSAEAKVETEDFVSWLFAGLTARERNVLVLRYFRGLSVPEAATVMKTTEKAVSQLHYRAIAKLRKRSGKLEG